MEWYHHRKGEFLSRENEELAEQVRKVKVECSGNRERDRACEIANEWKSS